MESIEQTFSKYYGALQDTDRNRALAVVEEALSEGISPEDIVFQVVIPSIEHMLSYLVDTKGATLSQHYICSKVSSEVTDRLLPIFTLKQEKKGTIVLGTARGDFHGLGKKIVGGCLTANMYNVHDLGINVEPEKFVDEALRVKAEIIGVSSMMVHTTLGEQGARGVRKILNERGLESHIKLIVGGAPYRFDPELYKKVNADGWSDNALEVVNLVETLIGKMRAE
jgi:methanogenic corrinoid protein MtbC1